MTQTLTRPTEAPTEAPQGVDADQLVLVVTQQDIDQGVQRQADGCAIVRAARRMYGEDSGWWDMGATLSLLPRHGNTRQQWVSDEARVFAIAFDRDRASVHPESFIFKRVEKPCS